jgi:Fe2+ or Zn2+ uptake regulation protein
MSRGLGSRQRDVLGVLLLEEDYPRTVEDIVWALHDPPSPSDLRSTYRALRRLRDLGLVDSPIHTLYELTERGGKLAHALWPDQTSPRRTKG